MQAWGTTEGSSFRAEILRSGSRQSFSMEVDIQPSASANNASNQSAVTMVNVEFYCKIANARILSTILSAIHHPRQKTQHIFANVTVSARGIGFTIEEAKSLQAHAALQRELFAEYNYHEKISTFKIDLTILLDCLTIFGNLNPTTGPSLQLAHSRERGNPLFLMLEEQGVITDVGLRTMEPDKIRDIDFRTVPVPNQVTLLSEFLKDSFNEIDWSSPTVTILLSPSAPFFRLTSSGPSGSCQVDLPNDSEVFEEFACTETRATSYQLKLLQPAVKALQVASRTRMRINERGMLCMQHWLKTEDNAQNGCVEFYIASNDDEDSRSDTEQ